MAISGSMACAATDRSPRRFAPRDDGGGLGMTVKVKVLGMGGIQCGYSKKVPSSPASDTGIKNNTLFIFVALLYLLSSISIYV